MINAKKIYFLGIGGSGCSSMALWLKSRGFDVAGSDICPSEVTKKLEESGIFVQIGHDINSRLQESDTIVYSSAIKDDNLELEFAKTAGKKIIKRAEMLGMMTREAKKAVAVCGSAGKSTTTGFLASVLNAAKLDPSVIVGGVFTGKDSGAQIGGGDYFLAEADEYDRSFLELKKIDLAVCTSIEAEHLDIYKNFQGVKDGFVRFFDGVDSDGVAVLCVDSQGVRDILARINCKKITFGLSKDADYRADNIRHKNAKTFFDVYKKRDLLGTVELKLIGNHNVLNALAAICAGMELGIDFKTAAKGAEDFDGIKRRIEKIAEVKGITIISDYAHHPTKISATLSALQEIKTGRIITVFQPHTFTRTRDFAENFAKSLEAGSDFVFLTEIYPAREKPIDGVDEKSIAKFFRNATSKITAKNCAAKECAKIAESGDIIAVVGAGDINCEIENLIRELENV